MVSHNMFSAFGISLFWGEGGDSIRKRRRFIVRTSKGTNLLECSPMVLVRIVGIRSCLYTGINSRMRGRMYNLSEE